MRTVNINSCGCIAMAKSNTHLKHWQCHRQQTLQKITPPQLSPENNIWNISTLVRTNTKKWQLIPRTLMIPRAFNDNCSSLGIAGTLTEPKFRPLLPNGCTNQRTGG